MAKKPSVSIGTICGTIGFVAIGIFCYLFNNIETASASSSVELHPYFSYTQTDVQTLDSLNSDKVITQAEVDHWVQVVFDLVKKNHKEIDATRAYAYLFTAQRDAAALSYQAKKKLAGNLTAVSTKTLCLLLPHECALIPPAEKPDAYSLKVAEIVGQKVMARLDEEKKVDNTTKAPNPPSEWDQHKTYFGSKFGSQITWILNSGNQFRPEKPKAYEPGEIILQKQELKNILSSITTEQIKIANKWSAGAGSILTSGQWLELANTYMAKHQVPLEKSIFIRSILAMGINDATISYFDAKYTYWEKRPKMLFPDLNMNLKAAASPSYPSGHATISMAAAIIMDYYFPENQTEWDKTAIEIGESRLWGGVHFPIDDYDGIELGKKIGKWIVSKIEDQ